MCNTFALFFPCNIFVSPIPFNVFGYFSNPQYLIPNVLQASVKEAKEGDEGQNGELSSGGRVDGNSTVDGMGSARCSGEG